MTTALRELLELPETITREATPQAEKFKQAFRAGLDDVNHDLQALARQSGNNEHMAIDAQRTQLIAAFQKASAKVDPTNPDKAAADIDRVLAAVATLRKKAGSLASSVNAKRDQWLKRESDFDAAVSRIDNLEDAQPAKAAAFRKVSEAVQARVDGGEFQQATAAFDKLQPKLDDVITQPEGPLPGMDGLDTGEVQALGPFDLADEAKDAINKGAKKGYDWLTSERKTTIIIENRTGKSLRWVQDELKHPKDAKWIKKSPPEIAAAKDGKPGTATIVVETDMRVRGASRATTSGWIIYEIPGSDKDKGRSTTVKVRIPWVSKDGKVKVEDGWYVDGPERYEVRGYKSNNDELTFWLTEAAKPRVKFEHTIKPFKIGSDKELEKGSQPGSILQHAHTIWHDKLSAEARQAVMHKQPAAAQLIVEVHGYASNTDAGDKNFDLSKRRAETVIKALVKAGFPATAIASPQPHGEWDMNSPTDDKKQETEDADWRKVVVKVSE